MTDGSIKRRGNAYELELSLLKEEHERIREMWGRAETDLVCALAKLRRAEEQIVSLETYATQYRWQLSDAVEERDAARDLLRRFYAATLEEFRIIAAHVPGVWGDARAEVGDYLRRLLDG